MPWVTDLAAIRLIEVGAIKSVEKGSYGMVERRSPQKVQQGQGLVEYALIIALVAIVVIAILVLMGPQIGDIFSAITNGL